MFQPIVENFNKTKENFDETKRLLEELKKLGLDTTELDKILSDANNAPKEVKTEPSVSKPETKPDVKDLEEKLKEKGELGEWYELLQVYNKVSQTKIVEGELSKMGEEKAKEHIVKQYFSLGRYLEDKKYIKINKASIELTNPLLKGIDEVKVDEINQEAYTKLLFSQSHNLVNSFPKLLGNKEFNKKMVEAKDRLTGIKGYLEIMLKNDFNDTSKFSIEDLYDAAMLKFNGLDPKELSIFKKGGAKSIYDTFRGVKYEPEVKQK